MKRGTKVGPWSDVGLGAGSQSVCWGEALSEDIYARHARCRGKGFLEALRALLEGTSR